MANIEIKMINTDDTICAISTPPGIGGIAVARVTGPDAIIIAQKIWRGKHSLDTTPSHMCRVGTVLDSHEEELDQAVATVFRAPHSFTGQDTVEFSIHGSRWVQQELIASLISSGARLAEAGEFTRRAFVSGHLDLAQAEGIADVIASTSRAAQRLALNQMRGGFSKRLLELRATLLELASLLELELDFSEEDVTFASRNKLMELTHEVCDTTNRLAKGFATGTAIRDGIPVAIVGATNAGKSSLLNALVQDDRAIVSDIHGTTRDVIEDRIILGDYSLRLMDTAGMRKTNDPIETLGIERSLQAMHGASLILLVIDSSAPVDQETVCSVHKTLSASSDTRLIVVLNKIDLALRSDLRLQEFKDVPQIRLCAMSGEGLSELREAMLSTIDSIVTATAGSDTIVTNARHYACLIEAKEAARRAINALENNIPADLIAEDIRQCISALGAITGTISTPEILSTIFSRFCVGK